MSQVEIKTNIAIIERRKNSSASEAKNETGKSSPLQRYRLQIKLNRIAPLTPSIVEGLIISRLRVSFEESRNDS